MHGIMHASSCSLRRCLSVLTHPLNCMYARFVGPADLAPECLDAQPGLAITDKVDMYAFGVLLREMLARCPPWQDKSPLQVAVAVTMHGQRPHAHLSVESQARMHACCARARARASATSCDMQLQLQQRRRRLIRGPA